MWDRFGEQMREVEDNLHEWITRAVDEALEEERQAAMKRAEFFLGGLGADD